MAPLLNAIIWLPLLGALVIWLLPVRNPTPAGVVAEPDPHGSHDAHVPPTPPPAGPRLIAALVTGVVLLLALVLFANYNRAVGGFQFETNTPWISIIGVSYHVGVDGIGLPMVVLNTLLVFLAVLVSWK